MAPHSVILTEGFPDCFPAPLQDLENGYFFLALPAGTQQKFEKAAVKRVVLTLPSGEKLHQALNRHPVSRELILYLSKKVCRDGGFKPGQNVSICVEPDTSPLQFPMPEEFQAVLDTDAEALAHFEKLTPGGKRSVIQFVLMVKASEKRIDRALHIARCLKRGITKVQEIARAFS